MPRRNKMAYHGPYTPKNKKKYKGDWTKVTYRSLKERSIMAYFDASSKVLQWNSEEVIIPYVYDVDGKYHRYFMDFWCRIECNDGIVREYLLEYKPHSKLTPPKAPKATLRKSRKRDARFLKEQIDYIKNSNKWAATKIYAQERNLIFYVISEKDVERMQFFIHL